MGDVSQILSGASTTPGIRIPNEPTARPAPPSRKNLPTATTAAPKSLRMTGISREVLGLISGSTADPSANGGASAADPAEGNATSLPPIAPTNNAFRKSSGGAARKWVWAPFTSSARTDGLILNHWVRAGVEYPDYPYARFDVHLDPLVYTEEEYETYFASGKEEGTSPPWSRSETDRLLEFARRFELRWPVIYDRWLGDEAGCNHRTMEELQHRYYSIASVLTKLRMGEAAQALSSSASNAAEAAALSSTDKMAIQTLGMGSSNQEVFNLTREMERKKQLHALWNRSREDEKEEANLRKELKIVEAHIRKLKKSGGTASVAASTSSMDFGTNQFDPYFSITAPVPTPGIPYLQSQRLANPATGGSTGLNKTLIAKMEGILTQLSIPQPKPTTPTQRVCDLYDSVRKSALVLLMLQKIAVKKENEVQTRKQKLSKLQSSTNSATTPAPTQLQQTSSSTTAKTSSLAPSSSIVGAMGNAPPPAKTLTKKRKPAKVTTTLKQAQRKRKKATTAVLPNPAAVQQPLAPLGGAGAVNKEEDKFSANKTMPS